jgi:hypothetical protein
MLVFLLILRFYECRVAQYDDDSADRSRGGGGVLILFPVGAGSFVFATVCVLFKVSNSLTNHIKC